MSREQKKKRLNNICTKETGDIAVLEFFSTQNFFEEQKVVLADVVAI
jgi:hypothetical protein